MKCPKCKRNVNPNLEEVGTQTKATCPVCGSYIKWVGSDELDAIVEATMNSKDTESTLTIKTMAPDSYYPKILDRVKKSLEKGFTSGEGSIIKPFDDTPYHYDFYYE